jgi:hypothetical protein
MLAIFEQQPPPGNQCTHVASEKLPEAQPERIRAGRQNCGRMSRLIKTAAEAAFRLRYVKQFFTLLCVTWVITLHFYLIYRYAKRCVYPLFNLVIIAVFFVFGVRG